MNHRPGLDRSQTRLFPERLEDYIAPENPVRILDAFVATTVTWVDKSDPASAPGTLQLAQANLVLAGSKAWSLGQPRSWAGGRAFF